MKASDLRTRLRALADRVTDDMDKTQYLKGIDKGMLSLEKTVDYAYQKLHPMTKEELLKNTTDEQRKIRLKRELGVKEDS